MEKISIKLSSKYKSLQEGFEWNDIPSFAVITGVNGIGKTQLLEVIKGKGDRPDGFGDLYLYCNKFNIAIIRPVNKIIKNNGKTTTTIYKQYDWICNNCINREVK